MIVVTGSEGFIGKALLKKLKETFPIPVQGIDIKSMGGFDELYGWFTTNKEYINFVYHLGAITDTTETNLDILERYNTISSQFIFDVCAGYNLPILYASSAATYGNGSRGFNDTNDTILDLAEFRQYQPLNPYGQTKHDFDVWAIPRTPKPLYWFGLKFFNVYGFDESHKGAMASMVYKMYNEIKSTGKINLFKSHLPEYGDGEQIRDFIYIDDVIDVLLWFYHNMAKVQHGIYNVGTGTGRTFNDLANILFDNLGLTPDISYFDMPLNIRDQYQYYTKAEIHKLRGAGYNKEFNTLESGVQKYVQILNNL